MLLLWMIINWTSAFLFRFRNPESDLDQMGNEQLTENNLCAAVIRKVSFRGGDLVDN